ncbi:MAG: peptidoglycan editing factor PgeF [Deltaproteobacteria bacterium]|nr:peptidoglycan editing factor PgeF [Deltaproteobacteria bacterium]
MNARGLQRSRQLDEIGVEHGFGTLHSVPITPTDVVFAKQVHGATLVRAEPGAARVEADALWTDRPGTAVGVVTADCVPILIAHQSGRFVCAVHAGWRGSAARIAARSVRALVEETRCRVEELRAAIGPHIGPCCYEVDGPVLEAIPDPGVYRASPRPGRALLDLFALNRLQLEIAGIPERQIERIGGCTACDPDLYPSYRRDRGSGRLLHFARAR